MLFGVGHLVIFKHVVLSELFATKFAWERTFLLLSVMLTFMAPQTSKCGELGIAHATSLRFALFIDTCKKHFVLPK